MSDLLEQINRAIAEEGNMEAISPERILDLSGEEVAELRKRASSHLPPPLHIDSQPLIRSGNGAYLGQEGRYRSRQRLAEAIGELAKKHNCAILLTDQNNYRGQGWLTISLPEQMEDIVQIGRKKFAATKMRIDQEQPGSIVLEDTVIGHQQDNYIKLYINPFQQAGRFSLSGFDQKINLIEMIVGQADRSQLWSPPPQSADDQLADAVIVLDMIPGFARAMRSTESEKELSELRDSLEALVSDIYQTQQALARALRKIDGLNQAGQLINQIDQQARLAVDSCDEQIHHWREVVDREQKLIQEKQAEHRSLKIDYDQALENLQIVDPEQMSKAVVEIVRIRSNRCVRDCRLVPNSQHPALEVTLWPLVLGNGEQRYICQQITFTLALDGSTQPQWIMPAHRPSSPHPHVSTSGTTCWGEAETPIREAMSRREFSTVVRFITGWARIYNPASPYVPIHLFPKTNLSEGYQVSK